MSSSLLLLQALGVNLLSPLTGTGGDLYVVFGLIVAVVILVSDLRGKLDDFVQPIDAIEGLTEKLLDQPRNKSEKNKGIVSEKTEPKGRLVAAEAIVLGSLPPPVEKLLEFDIESTTDWFEVGMEQGRFLSIERREDAVGNLTIDPKYNCFHANQYQQSSTKTVLQARFEIGKGRVFLHKGNRGFLRITVQDTETQQTVGEHEYLRGAGENNEVFFPLRFPTVTPQKALNQLPQLTELELTILAAIANTCGEATLSDQIANKIGAPSKVVYNECKILRDTGGFVFFTDDSFGSAMVKITGNGLKALRDRKAKK